MTHKFTNANGEEWIVRLDGATYKDVLDIGVDLLEIVPQLESYGKQDADDSVPKLELFETLGNDVVLLANVLYVICKDQADARQITPRQFASGFAGQSIIDAQFALYYAISSFCRPQVGRLLGAVIEKIQAVENLVTGKTEEAVELIKAVNVSELLAKLEKPTLKPAQQPESSPTAEKAGKRSSGTPNNGNSTSGTVSPMSVPVSETPS